MRYRGLGDSDLAVSEISLGTWLSFGEGEERARHIACLHRALELGVNLIDTANVYGFGESERLIGEALAGRPRGSYILATKLWGPMGVRADIRGRTFPNFRGDTLTWPEVTAGLTFTFGE